MKKNILFSILVGIYFFSFLLCFHNRIGENMAGFKTNWGYLLVFNMEILFLYFIFKQFFTKLSKYFCPEFIWMIHGFFLLSLAYDFLIIPGSVLLGSAILSNSIRSRF